MKIDKYNNLEYRFFNGEILTPEEELYLRNNSENPYFSILREQKQEGLNTSFDDFLSKVEYNGTENEKNNATIQPLIKKKPTIFSQIKTYWMAASLVMFMGILGGYLFVNEENGEINKNLRAVTQHDTEPTIENLSVPEKIERNSQDNQSIQNIVGEKNITENRDNQIFEEPKKKLSKNNTKIAVNNSHQPASKTNVDYNPNYVIINGKPVYNEQEAIALTEDAVNYLASNVKQTVEHAKNASYLSLQ